MRNYPWYPMAGIWLFIMVASIFYNTDNNYITFVPLGFSIFNIAVGNIIDAIKGIKN